MQTKTKPNLLRFTMKYVYTVYITCFNSYLMSSVNHIFVTDTNSAKHKI